MFLCCSAQGLGCLWWCVAWRGCPGAGALPCVAARAVAARAVAARVVNVYAVVVRLGGAGGGWVIKAVPVHTYKSLLYCEYGCRERKGEASAGGYYCVAPL